MLVVVDGEEDEEEERNLTERKNGESERDGRRLLRRLMQVLIRVLRVRLCMGLFASCATPISGLVHLALNTQNTGQTGPSRGKQAWTEHGGVDADVSINGRSEDRK